MIVSPCFEIKTFSPSIIYTFFFIVVQIRETNRQNELNILFDNSNQFIYQYSNQ